MSPEQAKDLSTDQRNDIFSFGSVLYEMLSGRPAFTGDTVSEVLASVIKTEPDWKLLPARLGSRLRELLRRSLEKNVRQRWYAIGDVRVEIEAVISGEGNTSRQEGEKLSTRRLLWKVALSLFVGLVAGAAIGIRVDRAWYFEPSAPTNIVRFQVPLGEGEQFPTTARAFLAISPR